MNALAGLMNPAAIGQNVQQAFQAGQQRRAEGETRNALAALAGDPTNQEAMGTLARYNPQAAFAMQDRAAEQRKLQQEQEAKAITEELTQRALAGDETALDELATVNFDRWKSVEANQREQATQESRVFGEAALDVLRLPYEQRQARIIGYAQQMPQFAEDINRIAYLPPAEQEAALRSAVVNAQLVERLHRMEDPRYQALVPGGTLVNTNDPSAVAQFAPGRGGQQVLQVQTPAQAAALPPGTRYVTPDGVEYIR